MKKNEETKKDNFMLYVPHYTDKIEWEKRKGKVVLIFHHDKLIEKFIRIFVKKPKVSTLELDEMGTAVWELIDGKRNIYEIGQELKKKFGEKAEPLYERLFLFIRYINRRNWIYFSKGLNKDE